MLDSLTKTELLSLQTEKDYYEKALAVLRSEYLTDPVTLGSFELGLSLHTAAPKIEAYYQFYNTSVIPSLGKQYRPCDTWVHWHGEQLCDIEELEARVREIGTEKRYNGCLSHLRAGMLNSFLLIIYITHLSRVKQLYYTQMSKAKALEISTPN